MASDATWNKLRYFKCNSSDNWGNENMIDDRHLMRLDDFRQYLGVPIHVTRAVATSGHSKNSWHYPRDDQYGNQIGACATDVVIPQYDWSPFDLVMDATRFGFTGIGYYPHWRYRGDVVGGLHLDSRPLKWDKDETINYNHSRWMGILTPDGKQRYIALTFENLVKYSNFIQPTDGVH